MDSLDRKIVSLLAVDSSASIGELAEKLDVPSSTLHQRIKKLETRGVITGYRAEVDKRQLGLKINALISLTPIDPAAPALEYGKVWHDAGTQLKKQNVFDDFIAGAEFLIREKYTSPSYLAASGRSNGGLLVGAAINQRPDLFAAALPGVGVMDMLRFQKFTIGWNWVADYGSSDNADEFKALYAFSPLHNIKAVNYPATMVFTSDHDDRVVPAHSFKYAATLQEKNTAAKPMIIRIDTNSGHGSSNTAKLIELTADSYAFVLYNMGK